MPPQKILLVKPHARLATILGLQRFMLLEPLEFGYLAAAVPGHDVRVLDLRLHRSPLRVFDEPDDLCKSRLGPHGSRCE